MNDENLFIPAKFLDERMMFKKEADFISQYLGEWEPTPLSAYTREYIDQLVNKGEISPSQGEELIRMRYNTLKDGEDDLKEVMMNEGTTVDKQP